MRKERIISVEKREFVNSEVTITCDICGNKVGNNRYISQNCYICHRDICDKCARHDENDVILNDNPTRYCKDCWEVGTKYREKMSNDRERHDNTIASLEQDWKNEAIKNIMQKPINTNESI